MNLKSRDQYHFKGYPGMIKGWWYRYQSRQTNTVVMFFQYYICKFPLFSTKYMIDVCISLCYQGRIQGGGGAHPARAPPLKLEKIWFFWLKIVIFHMKYPKNFMRPPPLILEKIWFFGVKSWFFTRNTPKIFAPPFSRRNFFKCAPL